MVSAPLHPAAAATWLPRVGSRVAVRHRLAEGGLTDVVGTLLAVDAEALTVDGARGVIEVTLADVVAGKVVPPRPVRAAPPHRALTIADLEQVMAGHWVAAERERLGGWLLRASSGFTNRANSVLPVGDPGLPLPAALDAVRAWYAARDLPPRLALAEPAAGGPDGEDPFPELRAVAAAAGWAPLPGAGALVLTASTAALRGAVSVPAGLAVRVDDAPDDAWTAGYRYRGQDLPEAGLALLCSAQERVFASVRDAAGAAVAVARGSVSDGWGGLTAVEVAPAHRRQGLARALLAATAGWVAGFGVRSLYLQASDANAPALALYRSAGFAVHHRYDYWAPPPPPPPRP